MSPSSVPNDGDSNQPRAIHTAQHEWLRTYTRAYGWCDPAWARRTGSKPEAWHWEYDNAQCAAENTS